MVQLVTPAFLGCWALMIPTLIFPFQEEDHPILLDVVAHVEIGIYPLQVTLQNTLAMLFKVVQSHVLPFKTLMV